MVGNMNVDELISYIEDACVALSRLPSAKPPERYTNWPDVLHSIMDAYGWHTPDEPRIMPTKDQVTKADNLSIWLLKLHPPHRKLVIARGCGYSWYKIAKIYKHAPSTCKAHWINALVTIMKEVNQQESRHEIHDEIMEWINRKK